MGKRELGGTKTSLILRMDVLLAGNEPSLWKGRLPALNVQRHYLWKSFRTKSNTIPGSAEKCSASARNPVRNQPGTLFDFNPAACSPCPGIPTCAPAWPVRTLQLRQSLQVGDAMTFRLLLGDPRRKLRNVFERHIV